MKSTTKLAVALALCMSFSPAISAVDAKIVRIAQVEKRAISPKINVIGSVHSRSNAEVTAGIQGRLVWVKEAGVNVKKGEVIAQLEPLRLELSKAKQQAEIERSKVTFARLTREFQRLDKLRKSQHVSETQIDEAKSQADLAKATLTLAELQLKLIEDDLARTQVKAPFSGVITKRHHQAGEDISRSKAIVSLTDPEHLEIRLHAPLRHSNRVKIGDSLKGYHNGGEFVATIRSLIPVSDIRSQTFELRLDLPLGVEDSFNVGELISLALPIAAKKFTTLVPRDAIILRSSGAYVYIIDEQNKAHKVAVKLGDGEGQWIAVEGQISADDNIVIRGAETLQEGQLVKFSDHESKLG
ncbi:MAG: efflux RND transporter periplasmic adaptor subunit [Parashewanella sp.]